MPRKQPSELDKMNQRLAVVRDRVRGVALKHHNGFYLYGRAGTSKTYTICTTLETHSYPYKYCSGRLTPMGLFDLLDEYRDGTIVLDDVGEILRQQTALQILLAALGNQPGGIRTIDYRRQGMAVSIPFRGSLILVSNLELHDAPLLAALKSRVTCLKYNPSNGEIAALMRVIALRGWSRDDVQMTPTECHVVTEYLIGESCRIGCDLDLRLLLDKAFPDYVQYRNGQTESHWKDLLSTTLLEELIDLKHPLRRLGRADRKAAEQQIVRELVARYPSRPDQLVAWREQTGKSDRAFYRRLEELGLAL